MSKVTKGHFYKLFILLVELENDLTEHKLVCFKINRTLLFYNLCNVIRNDVSVVKVHRICDNGQLHLESASSLLVHDYMELQGRHFCCTR